MARKKRYSSTGDRVRSILSTIAIIIAFLAFWQGMVSFGYADPFFFSSPELVMKDLVKMVSDGTAWKHTSITLREALEGLVIGGFLGTVIAFLLSRFSKVGDAFMPILVAFNGVPKIAFGPMLIIWFGIGIPTKVVVSVLMVVFVFLFNIMAGYNNVDRELVNAMRLMGGNGWQVFKNVTWPSCVPWFFASLRSGIGLAVTGAIVGEFIGSNKGLGYIILDAGGTYNMSRVLSCILILLVIMAIMDYIVRFVEGKALHWRPESNQ